MVQFLTVYCGECRTHGSQEGLPTFGKYGAFVLRDTIRIIEEEGQWWISLPNGCTMTVGDGREGETRESFERIVAAGKYNEWSADYQAEKTKAIEIARQAHEQNMSRPAYVKKYGAVQSV
jgi:hypothetical protein